MKNTRTVTRSGANKKSGDLNQTVEVLYQKLGDRWFAFSLINDEVFVGSITQGELEETSKLPKKKRNVGHS